MAGGRVEGFDWLGGAHTDWARHGAVQAVCRRRLTADFHTAEGGRLRYRLAALRKGCGPGPTRHDQGACWWFSEDFLALM